MPELLKSDIKSVNLNAEIFLKPVSDGEEHSVFEEGREGGLEGAGDLVSGKEAIDSGDVVPLLLQI